jgi:hypothetical protein
MSAETFEAALEDFANISHSAVSSKSTAYEDAKVETPDSLELERSNTNVEELHDDLDSADVIMEEVLEEGASIAPVHSSPARVTHNISVGDSQSSQESVIVSRKRHSDPIELQSSPTKSRGLKKKSTIDREKERERDAKVLQALQTCHVIVLDSLGNSHGVAIKTLKTYLTLEAQEKKKLEVVQKITGVYAKVCFFIYLDVVRCSL